MGESGTMNKLVLDDLQVSERDETAEISRFDPPRESSVIAGEVNALEECIVHLLRGIIV
jgi:hypothetical protein